MDVFFDNIMIMPTGIFTILLGFVAAYWAFVFVGVADLDLFDGADGIEGAIDGGIEGVSETAAEIAAEAAAEAVAEGSAEVVAETVAESAAATLLEGATESFGGDISIEVDTTEGISESLGLLSALKLRSVPVTVSISLIILLSWSISYFLVSYILTDLPFPFIINEMITFLLALFGGTLVTSVLVRPFDGAFETNQGESSIDLIGNIGIVSTSKVNERFGEIKIQSRNGTPLIMMARCDHTNELKNGDEVLVISIEKERNVLIVEPIQSLIAQKVHTRLQQWRNQRTRKKNRNS